MMWETAREYARNGIYVNPVRVSRKPDGKKDVQPIGLWRNTSSTSLADIATWEQGHPDAGLLIDTGKSGLVVIDPDGQEGIEAWLALDPPTTARVRTPGGGEHWYYRAHPEHVIGNDQNGKVAPAVDVRGLGGFVIAPPSHDGTGSWEWIDGPPDWADLPVVPDLVIERMKAEKPRGVTEPAALTTGDNLFDDAQRAFTVEQAKDFIRREREKLAATTGGFNGAINNFAMACAHFPWLVSRTACGKHMIKALGPKTGWTEPDRDDIATIESAYSATEAGKSWIAVKREAPAESEAAGAERLYIEAPAEMAYWLQENAGRGRMSGFFARAGVMVHTPRVDEAGYVPAPSGENGPVEIQPITGPVLAAKLQFLYDCYKMVDVKDEKGKKTGEKTEVAALFPVESARRVVDAPEALAGLRPLYGITSTPMVRADGCLIDVPGYDESSGFLFLPDDGVDVPAVTGLEVEQARKLLLDMVQDFPFATPDDRANYIGLLLTPLLRQVVPPSYKLFGIGAHQPGSGKSMLAEIAGIIHGWVMRSEVPEDEAEWRKQTTSILSTTSAPLIVLDNIMGVLKSSVLAGVLTAGRQITDRELGTSRTITVANDRVWVVTGNNLSIGGDLVRRTVTILIDPDRPDPEQRTDFVVQDLPGWVAENRNQILWALLTLIRAWVMQGMPEPERRQSDSFARWSRVIAGILEVAGIEGTFDDQSGKRVARGGDDDGLAQVLDLLHGRFGGKAFTVAEALEPKGEEGWLIEQRDWLPSPVLDKLGRSEAAGRKAFGWWFRNRIGRWVTTAEGRSMVIREAGTLKNVSMWRVEVR
jgi:hypothetical protein